MTRPLVAIDARLAPGQGGGIETVVAGLAEGFIHAKPEDFDIAFLTYTGWRSWLPSQVAATYDVIEVPQSLERNVTTRVRGALRLGSAATRIPIRSSWMLSPDRQMDELGPDLVHYPFQQSRVPRAPFIYHPHDLQHRHLPEFFSWFEWLKRDATLRAMCRRAEFVAVGTSWVKADVMASYGLPFDRVRVVTLAPIRRGTQEAPNGLVGDDLPRLPGRYLLYPAANWPHKNHARLFEALAVLRDRGLEVCVVLTGPVSSAHPDPMATARERGVEDLVVQLGYLSGPQLASVYQGATGLVAPTLYEAASFPVWEAFDAGVPVAASTVTALPEQVGSAGILFDPYDVDAIAGAIARLWLDSVYCQTLVSAGHARVRALSWRRTADRFSSHYRSVLGLAISDNDRRNLVDDVFPE